MTPTPPRLRQRPETFRDTLKEADSVAVRKLIGVNHQLFLGEELERAITFHIDGVPERAVNRREYRDDQAALMIVNGFVDLVADFEFRHRKTPSGIIGIIVSLK
jgi:hypothetical protein